MHPRPILHRRCRRTDFAAVCALLSASGICAPAAERRVLRRFRRLVSDLGSDLYVALVGGHLVGLVHVTYTRQLHEEALARVELLVVAPEARRRGVGAALAALAGERARRRGCRLVRCVAGGAMRDAEGFLLRGGWRAAGQEFQFDLGCPAQ